MLDVELEHPLAMVGDQFGHLPAMGGFEAFQFFPPAAQDVVTSPEQGTDRIGQFLDGCLLRHIDRLEPRHRSRKLLALRRAGAAGIMDELIRLIEFCTDGIGHMLQGIVELFRLHVTFLRWI
jgi:hypothetical protein